MAQNWWSIPEFIKQDSQQN